MRWAAQRDAAEPAVVQALRLAGWTVEKLSDKGFPDLLCVRNGEVVLLEVKSKRGRMKSAQVELHARLRAAGLPVAIVTTPDEALAAVRGEVRRTAMDVRVERRPGQRRSLSELATPNTFRTGRTS
ncbi:VRR-NUC domain-containing protein [Archangium lansingense]|uniref:VRR-NUC domain-containing protein n=1 Tax=Archangium lansingense TaxID=2995310 RepID=A0ABT4AF38_9BACT|nr:VRR-NUC domain-containing protein [Archangium lansinium]MCY1080311.1 VRR-NUC domain-containing protein [Archangium lansinium]